MMRKSKSKVITALKRKYGFSTVSGNRLKKEGENYTVSITYNITEGTMKVFIRDANDTMVKTEYKNAEDVKVLLKDIAELAKTNLNIDIDFNKKNTEAKVMKTASEPEFEPIVTELDEPIVSSEPEPIFKIEPTVSIEEPTPEPIEEPIPEPIPMPEPIEEPIPEPMPEPIEESEPTPTRNFAAPSEEDLQYQPIFVTDEDTYEAEDKVEEVEATYVPQKEVTYGAADNVDTALAEEVNKREFQPLRSYPNFPFQRPTSLVGIQKQIGDINASEELDVKLLEEVKHKEGSYYDVAQKFGTDDFIETEVPKPTLIDKAKATTRSISSKVPVKVAPLVFVLGAGLIGYYLLKRFGH